MKSRICLAMVLSVCGMLAAEGQSAPKKDRAKKAPVPPAEVTLPAGAKMTEPGVYTFTDAQGKKWIYRKSPFGLVRLEDKPAAPSAAPLAADASEITATEDGDTVHFERRGPFG